MNVGEICTREVVVADADTTLQDATRLMREHHVGDIVVVRGAAAGRVPIGILTDRDLVLEILAQGLAEESAQLRIADLLTEELLTAHEQEDPADVLKRMRAKGVRRVPIVDDDGALLGILTLDDLLDVLAAMLSDAAALAYRQPQREAERRL